MAKKSPGGGSSAARAGGSQPPGNPTIVWLSRARTQFLPADRDRLEEVLRRAYRQVEDLHTIVVCEKLVGYSVTGRPEILAIELIKRDRSYSRIVKIGNVEALGTEYRAWSEVEAYLESPDPVFMTLTDPEPDGSRELLEYDAASRAMSTSEVASLENVVIRTCRWGSPTADSVAQRIRYVLDYMCRKLYSHAQPKTPQQVAEYYKDKLREAIKIWWGPERVRRVRPLLLRLGGKPAKFQDPVDWLNWVLSPHGELCVPDCNFGPCHGDLHGRNVLIGLSNGVAVDEAVYDFEEMTLDGPIAWEFAKLEMELRVRALPFAIQALGKGNDDFRHALEFEQLLYARTKRLCGPSLRPEEAHPVEFEKEYPAPWRRLFEILLAIRRCAKVCLSGRERSECWKEEYLFTLAAYAVNTAKYKPYEKIHETLAYIAGGVAAAHFASKNRYCPRICPEKICIEDAVWDETTNVVVGQEPFGPDGQTLFPNYVVALAAPKREAQARDPDRVQTGVENMGTLCQLYPHVVAIEQELALAKIERSTLLENAEEVEKLRSEAAEILNDLRNELPTADEETLGKLGRCHKECAWAINRFGEQPSEAETVHYRRALECYQEAYKLHKHYYPGINMATLHFLLDDEEEARSVAHEVLGACSRATAEELQDVNERNWVEATQAEAYLLLGQCDRAVEYYRRAMSLDPTEAYAESPRRHARCILAKLPNEPGKSECERRIREALGIPLPNNPGRYASA